MIRPRRTWTHVLRCIQVLHALLWLRMTIIQQIADLFLLARSIVSTIRDSAHTLKVARGQRVGLPLVGATRTLGVIRLQAQPLQGPAECANASP
jgi:hypothetical protein